MRLDSKWSALLPTIRDICSISGIPGVSLGIVENNKTVYTASFGYADIESKTPCNSDTTFVLGSLSKSMTAALVASLHDDGTISSWDAPLETLLPEFHREDIYGEITLADLLTHRSGLASLDSLWLASNNIPYLPRSEAVRVLNYAPGIQPFRTQFIYNNFGYEVLRQVIEKASSETFAEVLRRRLLGPLGLNRTYYTGESRENEANPYAALEDGSIVPIAPPLAVVVLTNSQSLNGRVRWIGELLVEALLNNSHNAPDYSILAKESAEIALQQATRSLRREILQWSRDKASLQVAYMGRKVDTFAPLPYQEDSFYWTLTHDESAKLA
ncbi:hypothetical protein PENSOL_c076G05506 [Penicillium solitum]|uniref:Beta-lactamase-related domain-containing protein n=1 Tax=Penicillium solitum TaxID=60172 RepID=A0A1V6QFB2_9EURO|nr:uncharacterized protein PENSOL_c076G05506 [Penicillium solitum]OQD87908.1 hypothetical protein PENSOL_c076G05506 [Penicillium solitum]